MREGNKLAYKGKGSVEVDCVATASHLRPKSNKLNHLLVKLQQFFVCEIVEDHGGKIWATSKEDTGTIMYFVIRKYQEVINE